jgi:hypothetical protein
MWGGSEDKRSDSRVWLAEKIHRCKAAEVKRSLIILNCLLQSFFTPNSELCSVRHHVGGIGRIGTQNDFYFSRLWW